MREPILLYGNEDSGQLLSNAKCNLAIINCYVQSIQGTEAASVKRGQAINELKKDIKYVLSEVNTLFNSFSSENFQLELKLRALEILDTSVVPSTLLLNGKANVVYADNALNQFDKWLETRNSYNKFSYDFAILWTGLDLHGNMGSSTAGTTIYAYGLLSGYAHLGKICDPKIATGVVEFDGTYSTVLTTAHEIGHILGSEHGGPASTNIMAAAPRPTDKNRWFFSSCSRSDIQEYIATLK
ncbi:hypothetical protein Btru_065870 [Bulinus truncatus]|nr:hypothetical protein Btru_065870 [Bulinus truncatus]